MKNFCKSAFVYEIFIFVSNLYAIFIRFNLRTFFNDWSFFFFFILIISTTNIAAVLLNKLINNSTYIYHSSHFVHAM